MTVGELMDALADLDQEAWVFVSIWNEHHGEQQRIEVVDVVDEEEGVVLLEVE